MSESPSFIRSSVDIWHAALLSKLHLSPFRELEQMFGLSKFSAWPNAKGLNQLRMTLPSHGEEIPIFIGQTELGEMQSYYEQIIFEQAMVPTRDDSWHDLFNALIWFLFPRSKALLNRQHMEDIRQHGLSPRTPRRNRITHFDECGVVLACADPNLLAMLKAHQWQQVWIEHRDSWGRDIQAYVFGHANYEMLLAPFVGLTGKWLAVSVDEDFWAQTLTEQYCLLDEKLAQQVDEGDVFAKKDALSPLPLLGLPQWCEENKDDTFYANTDYFRAKTI
jgi:hypothetical protein